MVQLYHSDELLSNSKLSPCFLARFHRKHVIQRTHISVIEITGTASSAVHVIRHSFIHAKAMIIHQDFSAVDPAGNCDVFTRAKHDTLRTLFLSRFAHFIIAVIKTFLLL